MHTGDDLHQAMSRDDLAAFVDQLARSYMEDPQSWENSTIDQFLEALSGWISDMDGYFKNLGMPVPASPSWELIAQMLSAATAYE